MPPRELPARPNLDHLKKQARSLQREFLESNPEAISRFRDAQVTPASGGAKLAEALHVIALEYGFEGWPRLKAHVESLSEDPFAVLSAAIKSGDAQLVRNALARHPIVKSKIDEPLPNYSFDTPALLAAAWNDNREMVDALLAAGADINARTKWWAGGFGALEYSKPAMTSYLLERGAALDIHSASRLGLLDRVKEFVERDPEQVRARGGDGQTPLHYAANIEIAAFLLDHGADIDARDIDHESTAAQYMAAPRQDRTEVARYLVSRGAYADIFIAATIGDLALTRGLIDLDPSAVLISVSEKDFPKRNPHSGGCIYIFTFDWGKTPHMVAREFGHEEVFRLLMSRSPDWLQLAQACDVGDEALAQELRAKFPDAARSAPPEAASRIVGAAGRNDARAVHLMLESGWPATATGERNRTALHWSAWHGNAEAVRELILHGANLEARENEFNGTPLGWALHGSENSWHREVGEYGATIDALLAAGAKLPELRPGLEVSEEARAALRRHGHNIP
jgi:ankyrin repeat protein